MSQEFTIYHNPRCSKSRQTLAILEENGISPIITLYLDTPPTKQELATLLLKLDIPARQLLRKGEEAYKTLGLSDTTLRDTVLIQAMCEHPKLIERPIVIRKNKAILGRPPENVLSLINT